MKPTAFHSAVEPELDATACLDTQQAGLRREFRLAFEGTFARIAANPFLYAIEVDAARACPMHKFAYTVCYANFDDWIWVIAVVGRGIGGQGGSGNDGTGRGLDGWDLRLARTVMGAMPTALREHAETHSRHITSVMVRSDTCAGIAVRMIRATHAGNPCHPRHSIL